MAESRFDPSEQSLTPLQPCYPPTGHSPPPRVCLALYMPLHRLPLTSCDTRLSICPFFQLDGEPLRAGAMSHSTCIPAPAQWLLPKCWWMWVAHTRIEDRPAWLKQSVWGGRLGGTELDKDAQNTRLRCLEFGLCSPRWIVDGPGDVSGMVNL